MDGVRNFNFFNDWHFNFLVDWKLFSMMMMNCMNLIWNFNLDVLAVKTRNLMNYLSICFIICLILTVHLLHHHHIELTLQKVSSIPGRQLMQSKTTNRMISSNAHKTRHDQVLHQTSMPFYLLVFGMSTSRKLNCIQYSKVGGFVIEMMTNKVVFIVKRKTLKYCPSMFHHHLKISFALISNSKP